MDPHDDTRLGRLILVRHGESEGNRDRTFNRNPDVPLTPYGREQASVAASRIAVDYQPVRIVTSPFTRARQTAEIIAEVFQLPVEIEPALREQGFGTFAGRPYDAMFEDASYHAAPRTHWRPAGGESLLDVYERVVPAFDRIAQVSVGHDVIVVSHGGVMLALCAYVTGAWENVTLTPNAGIVVVEHRGGRPIANAVSGLL
jgi:broad specificity phosphatase PhoE